MLLLLTLPVLLLVPLSLPAAAPGHGRKVLQTTAAPGGSCGAAVNARCTTGQCCSQWGYCGITSSHCSTGCQPFYSASNSACAGSGSVAPAPPPTTTPTPPPPTTTGCVDTYAACQGWGPASCIYGGVPQLCPCMCRAGTPPPAAPPPVAPAPAPQPPSVGTVQTSIGVSYHMYEGYNFPAMPEYGVAGQYLPGSNPGYTINGLYVSVGWLAAITACMEA